MTGVGAETAGAGHAQLAVRLPFLPQHGPGVVIRGLLATQLHHGGEGTHIHYSRYQVCRQRRDGGDCLYRPHLQQQQQQQQQ